jgi:hypothetical protein
VVSLPEFEKIETVKNDRSSDEDIKLDVIFGTTLYRNKIFDESLVFSAEKPVFFKIKSLDNKSCDFIIQFENRNTSKIEKTLDLQMVDRDINKKIELMKGQYIVMILKDGRQLLRKEITIN